MFGKSKEEKAEEKKLKEDAQYKEEMDNLYAPTNDGIKRALSALITQDDDRHKLFESGANTYFRLLGGDMNTFINTNAVLLNASIQMKMLEQLEELNKKLSKDN